MVDFAYPTAHREKINESKKINKFLDLPRELEKLYNMRVSVIPIVVSTQRLGKKSGGIGNQKKNQDHSELNIIKIGLNIQKSPEDMRRLSVTQTPVADH